MWRVWFCVTVFAVQVDAAVYNYKNSGLTEIPNNVPEDATTVDLTGNQITDVSSHNLPSRVEEIILDQNQITSIPDNVFSSLNKLKYISFKYNQVSSVGKKAFVGPYSESGVTINLNFNKLTEFPDVTEASVSSMELGGNNIAEVPLDRIRGVNWPGALDLHGNQLRTFPDPRKGAASFKQLVLMSNPLACDCELAWLKDARANNWVEVALDDQPCAEPAGARGKTWNEIVDSFLVCDPDENLTTTTSRSLVDKRTTTRRSHNVFEMDPTPDSLAAPVRSLGMLVTAIIAVASLHM